MPDEESRRQPELRLPDQEQRGDTLRLWLLGGLRVERGGVLVDGRAWQRRSGKTVVKMLAATPGHRLHREVLAGRLWPEADAHAARDSLHQALKAARRALAVGGADDSPLRLADDMVWLAGAWVDVDAFEQLASEGLSRGDGERLAKAAELYGGELLPEDRYEDWAEARRKALSGIQLRVLLALAGQLERRGAYGAAIERAQQALEIDVTREDVHRQLMRLYAEAGQVHQALRQYHTCRRVLAAELEAEPDEDTEALHADLLAGKGRREPEGVSEEVAISLPAVVRRARETQFVGRARPLGVLEERLGRLLLGSGAAVLMSGEAGVGKTRLAVEAAAAGYARGVLVLWGTSYAEEGRLAYGPFVEALDEYLTGLTVTRREQILGRYPEVARLLSIGDRAGAGAHHADTRLQLFAAVGRLLAELSQVQPLLLVLDDLHAADEASIELLHYLMRSCGQHAWLLLGAFREEEVETGGRLQSVVSAALRRDLAQRIELMRLSRGEARVLVCSLVDGEVDNVLLDDLFERSLGNPLFLQELIRAMRDAGEIAVRNGRSHAVAGSPAVIPPGARELVTARASRLSGEALGVVSLAAVAGMECSLRLLREAGELPESSLVDALDEILALRLLEERAGAGGGHGYGFRHPLFREALYAHLSQARRERLHTRVAAATERLTPDEVEGLAFHYSRSTNAAKAVTYLQRAGDLAFSRYAADVATAHYRDALGLLDPQRDAADIARLQTRLGEALIVLGHFDDALAQLEAAGRYYREAGSLEELARAVAGLAMAHRERGTCDDGAAAVVALLPEVKRGDELCISVGAAINLYLALAHACRGAGRSEEALPAAEEAARLARAADNRWLLAMAEMRRGDALATLGQRVEGLRILEEAIALAEEVGNLDALGRALNNAGAVHAQLGDIMRSEACRERAIAVFERVGNPTQQAFCLTLLASTRYDAGQWEQARSMVGRVFQIHEAVDVSWYVPYALCTLGDIEAASGDAANARRCFAEARTLTQQRSNPQIEAWIEAGLAGAELMDSRPERAVAALTSFLAAEERGPNDRAIVSVPLIEALLQLDRLAEAEEAACRAMAAVDRVQARARIQLLKVNGQVLARRSRWEEAEASLRRSIEEAGALPQPLSEALAWEELGTIWDRRGDREQAASCFTHARDIFRRLSAPHLLARAESAIGELRVTSSRS